MHYVYVLKSLKDGRTYVGATNNLERRLHEHNAGKSQSTKHRVPFVLLFSEEYEDSTMAKKRESYWKSGAGRRKLKQYFNSISNNE